MVVKSIQLLLLLSYMPICAQQCPEVLLSISNSELYAGIDNRIEIIARNYDCVSRDNVEVYYQPNLSSRRSKELNIIEENGGFIINPNSAGILKLVVKINNDTTILIRRIQPLIAKIYLSGYSSDSSVGVMEMRHQRGLSAIVECCGFELNCRVISYELLRISSNDAVERVINKGARFNEESQNLINMASSGDLYVFRRINYDCIQGQGLLRSEGLIIEVR